MTASSSSTISTELMHPRFQWNTLFRGDTDRPEFNACVGNNGAPGIYEYADGFGDSVMLLIEELKQRQGALDTLIYPICFNLRHSVELNVKALIGSLDQLSKVSKRPLSSDVKSVIGQHDIQNLWNFFVQNAASIDSRFTQETAHLDSHIQCLAETDSTGQTFRYSYDTQSVKHLTEVSLINVLVLQEQFEDIRERFESVRSLMSYLLYEYRMGTFTRHLSRKDIFSIAELLPTRDKWGTANFIAVKTMVAINHNLSGQELSLAFTKIQKTRDTARMIGLPTTVPGLSAADFKELNDIWKIAWERSVLYEILRNDIYGGESTTPFTGPVKLSTQHEFLNSAKKDPTQANQLFKQWATPDKLAGLLALREAGSYYFCEEHDSRFLNYQKNMKAAFCSGGAIWQAEIAYTWQRSVSSSNYPSFIVENLKRTGFTHDATEVAEDLFA